VQLGVSKHGQIIKKYAGPDYQKICRDRLLRNIFIDDDGKRISIQTNNCRQLAIDFRVLHAGNGLLQISTHLMPH
jgi:hypothetical protein